jgi:hypothetical protein
MGLRKSHPHPRGTQQDGGAVGGPAARHDVHCVRDDPGARALWGVHVDNEHREPPRVSTATPGMHVARFNADVRKHDPEFETTGNYGKRAPRLFVAVYVLQILYV